MPSSIQPYNSDECSSANSTNSANARCTKEEESQRNFNLEALMGFLVKDIEDANSKEFELDMHGEGDAHISANAVHLLDSSFGIVDSLTLVNCNRSELELLVDQDQVVFDEFDNHFEHSPDECTVTKLTAHSNNGLFRQRKRSGVRRGDKDTITFIVPTKIV